MTSISKRRIVPQPVRKQFFVGGVSAARIRSVYHRIFQLVAGQPPHRRSRLSRRDYRTV